MRNSIHVIRTQNKMKKLENDLIRFTSMYGQETKQVLLVQEYIQVQKEKIAGRTPMI